MRDIPGYPTTLHCRDGGVVADGPRIESGHRARWAVLLVAVVAALCTASASMPWQPTTSGLLDVISSGLRLGDDGGRDLRDGRTVVRTLDASSVGQIVVVATARTDARPETFAVRVRDPDLWRGDSVPAAGRLSDPIRADEIARIPLSAEDIQALRHCRPGDCDVKLSDRQIARIQAAARGSDDWNRAALQAFRAGLAQLLETYRREGLPGLAALHDHETRIHPQAAFERLLASTSTPHDFAPALARYLERYPDLPLPAGAEEQFYWLEIAAASKPTLQVWHATIRRPPRGGSAEVVVLSRQVFASHYINASLTLMFLTPAVPERYLVYVNWTAVDGLEGFFAGLRRFFVERRVRSAARSAFEVLKERLERPD